MSIKIRHATADEIAASELLRLCRCGGEPELRDDYNIAPPSAFDEWDGEYWVSCPSCPQSTDDHDSPRAAVEAWNAMTQEAA